MEDLNTGDFAQLGNVDTLSTQKYRRNLLAICVICIATVWFPDLSLDNIDIIGLKPGEGKGFLLWIVALALIAYNAWQYFYSLNQDLLSWKSKFEVQVVGVHHSVDPVTLVRNGTVQHDHRGTKMINGIVPYKDLPKKLAITGWAVGADAPEPQYRKTNWFITESDVEFVRNEMNHHENFGLRLPKALLIAAVMSCVFEVYIGTQSLVSTAGVEKEPLITEAPDG